MVFAAKGVDNLWQVTSLMSFVSKCWRNGFFLVLLQVFGYLVPIFLWQGELLKLTSMMDISTFIYSFRVLLVNPFLFLVIDTCRVVVVSFLFTCRVVVSLFTGRYI